MRGLAIAYEVVDVTAIPQSGRQFDLILDSYCINHIVFSRERRSVFESAKAMLKPKGCYLVSSSVYESGRHSPEERVVDRSTGQTYDTYDGDCLYDPSTDYYYEPVGKAPSELEQAEVCSDSLLINGKTYIPKRCYRERKSALALSELCKFGVPTPTMSGHASKGEMATIVYEKVQARPWTATTRLKAAESLARLHRIAISEVGDELAGLVRSSAPNRDRTLNGVKDYRDLEESASNWRTEYLGLAGEIEWLVAGGEPQSGMESLVHGDYFSRNLLPSDEGLKIVDWDCLALGDPMWDLGFLVGADSDVGEEEAAEVVAAYSRLAPVDREVVSWHRRCWRALWKLRELRERGVAEA